MNENSNAYLTIHDIFSLSFREIKERFAPFFLLAAAGIFFNWLLMGLCFGFNPITQTQAQQAHPILSLFASLLSALVGLWSAAALVLYICKRAASVKEAFLMGVGKIWRLFIASAIFLVGLTVSVAVLLLVMILSMGWAEGNTVIFVLAIMVFGLLAVAVALGAIVFCLFLPYKLILTEDSVFGCFAASFSLVKGNFWQTFGFFIVLTLILLLISMIGGAVLGVLMLLFTLILPAATGLISFLWVPVGALGALVFQVSTVAFYLDRNSGGTQTTETEDNTPSLEQGMQQ